MVKETLVEMLILPLSLSLITFGGHAAAQDRNRPISIIVPYTPGENTPDILGRLIASQLQQRWRQTVVVENRPGASGNIGTAAAAKAPSDGNTLLVAAPAFVQNVGLFRSLSYDPIQDFDPVINLASISIGLVVNPDFPASSVSEFVKYVRSRPDEVNYASAGNGTPHHLTMELFKRAAGVQLKHVPYRGSGPAVVDVIAGHVSAMFLPLPVAMPLASAGRLRLLAVAGRNRSQMAPEVPTLLEAGVSGVDVSLWNGLLLPAHTPEAVVRNYNQTVNEVLQSPDIGALLKKQGIIPVGGTSRAFADLLRAEIEKWKRVIEEARITAE